MCTMKWLKIFLNKRRKNNFFNNEISIKNDINIFI